VIYSIIPNEVIFSVLKSDESFKLEEVEYRGCLLQIAVDRDKGASIQRIISTDPRDYLNQELQPGTIFSMEKINRF